MKNFQKPILNNENEVSAKQNEERKNNFTNLTPRRGSLPADYNRVLPKSPKLPLTAPLPEEDYGEVLDNLLNKGKNSPNLLKKLTDEQESKILRLESEKTQLLTQKQEWEKSQLKVNQLEKSILKLNKKLEEQKTELEQTGNDLYQLGEKNDELNQQLAQERLNSRKLEKRLEQQINENDWLRSSFNQTKTELLEKTNELVNLKKIEREEKEEWRKIFTEQEEKYELEKKEREKVFSKQINNLRTFQLTAETPLTIGRGRGLHKKSYSLSLPSSRSASPRDSTYEEIYSAEQKDPLLFELDKTNRFNSFANSPLRNENTDSFENVFADLLNEVDNVVNDNNREQELLSERSQLIEQNETLKFNQLQLENAYKTLFDEKVEQERLLENFNQKELKWEKERAEHEKLLFNYTQNEQTLTNKNQSLEEEVAELKYQLAEKESQQRQIDKQVEQEDEELIEILLSAKLEADQLRHEIQQTQILINKK
ncbi:MAG: hypothetical protein MRERC_4c083 [Mycoplasmataceae bacterium RC_NB112A]|nr:MAG: hypothetical protein MRERC_4c083 [Mycoplasmataceae bacterium RC_NB112A]